MRRPRMPKEPAAVNGIIRRKYRRLKSKAQCLYTGASLADSMQKDSVLPCLGKHGVLYFDPAGTTFTLRELIYSSGLLVTQ